MRAALSLEFHRQVEPVEAFDSDLCLLLAISMNMIRALSRTCTAANAPRAVSRLLPARPTVFARSFAVLPKRSDADAEAAPSANRASFTRPRMPASVVSRRR